MPNHPNNVRHSVNEFPNPLPVQTLLLLVVILFENRHPKVLEEGFCDSKV